MEKGPCVENMRAHWHTRVAGPLSEKSVFNRSCTSFRFIHLQLMSHSPNVTRCCGSFSSDSACSIAAIQRLKLFKCVRIRGSSAVCDSPRARAFVFPLLAYDPRYLPVNKRSQLRSQSSQIGHVSKPKFVVCLELSMHVMISANCASAGQSQYKHKQQVAFVHYMMLL
jgi:hypothetical protein